MEGVLNKKKLATISGLSFPVCPGLKLSFIFSQFGLHVYGINNSCFPNARTMVPFVFNMW